MARRVGAGSKTLRLLLFLVLSVVASGVQKLHPQEVESPSQKCLVVTELANTVRHKNQFKAVFHPSWTLLLQHPSGGPHIVDLMAFCEPGACRSLPKDCKEVKDGKPSPPTRPGSCRFQHLSATYVKQPYKYGLSLTFMTSDAFAEVAKQYDYVMRSDADAVLMPGLRHWVPEHGSSVGRGFMGTPFTWSRLQQEAEKLHLRHSGVHGMQSTFYVRASKVVAFARMLVQLSGHFFEHEFTKEDCTDVERQQKGVHCGWPNWYQQVSTLYATDLAANHILGEPKFQESQVSDKLDVCATFCHDLTQLKPKARDIAQVHLLTAKGFVGKGFLRQEKEGEFCRLATETWPNLLIPKTEDWGMVDESVNTFFLRTLSTSLPGMCSKGGSGRSIMRSGG